jgi:hypothetical protein
MLRLKTTALSLLLSLSIALTASAQRTLKGTVIDAQTKQPVVGATVTGGDHQSAVADDNGQFEWKTGTALQTITVSSVGYLNKTVTIKENTGGLLIFLNPPTICSIPSRSPAGPRAKKTTS